MTKWTLGIVAAIAAVVAAIAFYWYRDDPLAVTKRMRITLEFFVDGKPVSASGVVETWIRAGNPQNSQSGARAQWGGEAIVVELPGRPVAFAVMGLILYEDGAYRGRGGGVPWSMLVGGFNILKIKAQSNRGSLGGLTQVHISEIRSLKGSAEVPREYWPNLITFADIKDLKSARGIDPEKLGAALGPGVELIRVVVTVSDEPLTKRLDTIIPWLEQYNPRLLEDKRGEYIRTRKDNIGMDLRYVAFKGRLK